jgi:hypothetical protein
MAPTPPGCPLGAGRRPRRLIRDHGAAAYAEARRFEREALDFLTRRRRIPPTVISTRKIPPRMGLDHLSRAD